MKNVWKDKFFHRLKYGSIEEFEELMDVYKNYLRMDYDVIIAAIKQGRVDVVNLLIKNGARVNPYQKYSSSPLFEAAACGRDDIVKVLIQAGANVNQVTIEGIDLDSGRTALHRAARALRADVVKILIENGADRHHRNVGEFYDSQTTQKR